MCRSQRRAAGGYITESTAGWQLLGLGPGEGGPLRAILHASALLVLETHKPLSSLRAWLDHGAGEARPVTCHPTCRSGPGHGGPMTALHPACSPHQPASLLGLTLSVSAGEEQSVGMDTTIPCTTEMGADMDTDADVYGCGYADMDGCGQTRMQTPTSSLWALLLEDPCLTWLCWGLAIPWLFVWGQGQELQWTRTPHHHVVAMAMLPTLATTRVAPGNHWVQCSPCVWAGSCSGVSVAVCVTATHAFPNL